MKNTLPFLLIFLCVLGCNKFGPGSSSTSSADATNANANAAPVAPKQVVDLPATFLKTKDEIKKIVGGTPKAETPWLEYSLEMADLTFMFDKSGKATHCNFSFKPIYVGNASISGLDTAEKLATMAGLDIKGKTPTYSQEIADSYDQEINGKRAHVAIYKTSGRFDKIIITPDLSPHK